MKPLLIVLAAALGMSACAGTVRPAGPPARAQGDALLILPGLGYGSDGARAFRAVGEAAQVEGIDVYAPGFLRRGGLETSRRSLEAFIRESHFERYRRVHVFAFLAGGWAVNPLLNRGVLPNLASIVYDRSPYQERAPRIAATDLPLLAWTRYGRLIFDLARMPYTAMDGRDVPIGLLVESTPTDFIRHHSAAAARSGAYDFDCAARGQHYDDCAYVPLAHDALYRRFAEVWPEIRTFIRTGRFSDAANRTPPAVFAPAGAR